MARTKALDLFEYIPLRVAVGIVDLLPIDVALSCGRGLAKMSWFLLGRRRRTAIENVLFSGVTTDIREAERIAKASFESFGMVTVESLAAKKLLTPDTLKDHIDISMPPETERLLADPEIGGIFVSAHLGNWEVSGHVISFWKGLVAVARTMNNPYSQAFMLRRNPRMHMEIIAKHSADRMSLIRPLKAGRMLGLVADQHAASHGVTADFFGHPAKTVTSPARLHLATRCPIVCGYCVRTGPMKFKMRASEPLMYEKTADHDSDILRITSDLNKRLEAFIRMYPEQYLWAHRRWR